MNKHKLFVYGSLRPKGKEATHLLRWYALYDTGRFPYIKAGNTNVFGNIIDVDDEKLRQLDHYEGVEQGFYKRVKEKALPKDYLEDPYDRQAIEVWVYVAGSVAPKLIPSGDWNKRNV